MRLAIIAALAENRVIGNQGRIPWHEDPSLKELRRADLKRFKQLTINHPVIMGRKTCDSLPQPLDKRVNIVVTENQDYKADYRVIVATSIPEAIEIAERREDPDGTTFIIGGQKIYEQTIQQADKMFLTLIDGKFPGDAFFPEYNTDEWATASKEEHEGFKFQNLVRKSI